MDAPQAATGVAVLQDMPALPGWPESRWNDFVADAHSFRRMWGKRAIELGWTPLELFAVSREKPFALHAWGAVPFINGRKVVEVAADTIWIETGRETIDHETGEVTANRLRISKRRVAVDAVLAWECKTDQRNKVAA